MEERPTRPRRAFGTAVVVAAAMLRGMLLCGSPLLNDARGVEEVVEEERVEEGWLSRSRRGGSWREGQEDESRRSVTKGPDVRLLGWRGVRVGEAANPGPYTEGGATGSLTALQGRTWTEVGHGRWVKDEGGFGGYDDSGADTAFAELEAWLDDRELGLAGEGVEAGEEVIGVEEDWSGEGWRSDEGGCAGGATGSGSERGGTIEGWRESERGRRDRSEDAFFGGVPQSGAGFGSEIAGGWKWGGRSPLGLDAG